MLIKYNNHLINKISNDNFDNNFIILNLYRNDNDINYDINDNRCFRLVFYDLIKNKSFSFIIYFYYNKKFNYIQISYNYIKMYFFAFKCFIFKRNINEIRIKPKNKKLYKLSLKISNYLKNAYKI